MKTTKEPPKERQEMKPKALRGVIVNYRTGPKTQRSRECILGFPAVKSYGAAAQLIGKKVGWPVKEPKIRGKITSLHGKSGLVRARFRKGVPGEAIGTPVEIIG